MNFCFTSSWNVLNNVSGKYCFIIWQCLCYFVMTWPTFVGLIFFGRSLSVVCPRFDQRPGETTRLSYIFGLNIRFRNGILCVCHKLKWHDIATKWGEGGIPQKHIFRQVVFTIVQFAFVQQGFGLLFRSTVSCSPGQLLTEQLLTWTLVHQTNKWTLAHQWMFNENFFF